MNLNVSRQQKPVSKRKYFRYPPILPIVYYEGKDSWTADMHLRDRIWNGAAFGSYILDFVYEVVRNQDYTNAELLENTTPSIRRIIRDTLYSLLMKINVPVEEANRYAESVEECRMGYLFENIEKMDIQAERRNTAQVRTEAEMAKQEAEAARQEAEAAKQKLISLVERKLAKGQTEEQIAEDLFEPVEYIRELLDKIKSC
ncbi:MAG: Rpn family recombination-promoting nuclease/putative transposase [Clostridiales bacterium]|nr:Rpn family recombination-promoting nuclease/putative transposase [Clostridiales bacterium]